jgi:hypothetical protein
MSIFEEAVSIVREAECLVIGARLKPRWKPVEPTIDALVHVPWFLLAGARERLATFGIWLLLVPAWWCILIGIVWVTPGGPTASLHAPSGWVIAGLMATGSVLFPLPSRPGRLGVRSQQVASLAKHIRSVAPDEATIKLLQSGVAALGSVASTRITRINWLLGICWAGLVWVASHWVFTPDVSNAMRQQAIVRVLGGLAIFSFFGIGAMCYEATVRMVKQTIDFAFLQASDARGPSKG